MVIDCAVVIVPAAGEITGSATPAVSVVVDEMLAG
jgi:hypothetical protein